MTKEIKRCSWADSSETMIDYHDNEWAIPEHDENKLFEMLSLEAFQAGLSWSTILNKRANCRRAFSDFSIEVVAQYKTIEMKKLSEDAGIVRNKLKIADTVNNAQVLAEWHKDGKTFDEYVWSFVDNKPIINHYQNESEMPAQTEMAQKISKDMKKQGLKFVGPTIVYSFMQAIGMVNDHIDSCSFK